MKIRTKRYLDNLLSCLPGSGKTLKAIYHRLLYEKRKLALKAMLFFAKYHIPDPEAIYWIDPKRIASHTNYIKRGNIHFEDRVFHMIKDKGRVYDGDWDISPYRFSDMAVYKALAQRIRYGMEWEETEFYRNGLRQIETGRILWGCENRKDWDERCRYIDSLIESIRRNGYKLAHHVSVDRRNAQRFLIKEMSEEVTVNIGRNGEYFFQDGRHRLAIAKILGVKRISVRVLVRHRKWQELREKLVSMPKGWRGTASERARLYQQVNHPDLSDISAICSCEDRFRANIKLI